MDKTTQVNFPIVSPNAMYRRIWRNHTVTDLYDPSNRGIPLTNSWSQMKPISHRPKSLNFSAEAINKTKITYLESPLSRLSPMGFNETPSGSISREKTPPFSSNSSITSISGLPAYKPPLKKMKDDESCASSTKCRCYDVESGKHGLHITNTSDGLSWRRLHMSRAKLKASATTSELLSGFAMISMVELQINSPTNVPEWLFIMFAVCTTVLVGVHIFALMISTYILPNIEAIAKLEICEMVSESPHERMKGFIEIAWAFSTILGLFLFLIELSILCWVKFWDYSFMAAIAATIVVIPVLIVFVLFAAHFYHSLVVFKCNSCTSDMEKLENIKKHLDEVTVAV